MCVQIFIERIPNIGKENNFNVYSKCTYTSPQTEMTML